MNAQDPPVVRLEMHLQDEQSIIFNENNDLKKIGDEVKNTKLTAWSQLNQTDLEARKYLYHEIPKY